MTPEAQRIAIARFLFPDLEFSEDDLHWHHQGRSGPMHDYLNDLNAMHEVENVILDRGVWMDYKNELWQIWTRQTNAVEQRTKSIYGDDMTHATAAQRAEAFLRTLGLWK